MDPRQSIPARRDRRRVRRMRLAIHPVQRHLAPRRLSVRIRRAQDVIPFAVVPIHPVQIDMHRVPRQPHREVSRLRPPRAHIRHIRAILHIAIPLALREIGELRHIQLQLRIAMLIQRGRLLRALNRNRLLRRLVPSVLLHPRNPHRSRRNRLAEQIPRVQLHHRCLPIQVESPVHRRAHRKLRQIVPPHFKVHPPRPLVARRAIHFDRHLIVPRRQLRSCLPVVAHNSEPVRLQRLFQQRLLLAVHNRQLHPLARHGSPRIVQHQGPQMHRLSRLMQHLVRLHAHRLPVHQVNIRIDRRRRPRPILTHQRARHRQRRIIARRARNRNHQRRFSIHPRRRRAHHLARHRLRARIGTLWDLVLQRPLQPHSAKTLPRHRIHRIHPRRQRLARHRPLIQRQPQRQQIRRNRPNRQHARTRPNAIPNPPPPNLVRLVPLLILRPRQRHAQRTRPRRKLHRRLRRLRPRRRQRPHRRAPSRDGRHGKRKLKANRVASQHRPRPTFAHYHRRRRLRRRRCAARKHHSRKRPNHPGKQLSKNPPPLHGKQS